MVDGLVARGAEAVDEPRLELEAGMVGAQVHAHGETVWQVVVSDDQQVRALG